MMPVIRKLTRKEVSILSSSIVFGGHTLYECGTLTYEEYTVLFKEGDHVWSTLINGKCYYTTVEVIGDLASQGLL